MRLNTLFALLLAAAFVGACASGDHPKSVYVGVDDSGAPSGPDATTLYSNDEGGAVDFGSDSGAGDGSSAGEGGGAGILLANVHIVPDNATLTVSAGGSASLVYKVLGTYDGSSTEVDVTSRFVFYVPDNYLVGGFPQDGGPTFSTHVPTGSTDVPQGGGQVTIQAQAQNPDGSLLTAKTSLTVHLQALSLPDPTGAVVPANPQNLYGDSGGAGDAGSSDAAVADAGPEDSGSGDAAHSGDSGAVDAASGDAASADAASGDAGLGEAGTADAGAADSATSDAAAPEAGPPGQSDPTRAPVVFYPNDGVMLPPNLKLLEVHWQPGSARNTLYRVRFESTFASIVYYVRCNSLGGALPTGSCGMLLDSAGFGYLSQSNAGHGPITLTVAGTDDAGSGFGVSAPVGIQFAQQSVNGGVYYWDVTDTRIMRFDFGGTQTTPETFIQPGDYGTASGQCIGCHALSPDGSKMAASAGGQNAGYIVYMRDLAKPLTPPAPARTDPTFLTLNEPLTNRIQFASFSPAGDQFVSVYGETAADAGTDRNTLWFHDGNTGERIVGAEKVLTFEPDHPDWSPDGTMIAMTHVGTHNTSQREYSGGVDVARFTNNVLGTPFTVIPNLVPGKNRYNPSFVPDSSFFFYSETTCAVGHENQESCDSDVELNTSATTWAAQPTANATPVHLDKVAKPGAADKGATPIDTFPRSAPFKTVQGAGRLFWFTVASQRQAGLRSHVTSTQQLLWMFAVDPDKIMAGVDGSFTGFFVPFQDLSTSNHIAEWTQKIVAQTPVPDAPSPPPAPLPPIPPPAPK